MPIIIWYFTFSMFFFVDASQIDYDTATHVGTGIGTSAGIEIATKVPYIHIIKSLCKSNIFSTF